MTNVLSPTSVPCETPTAKAHAGRALALGGLGRELCGLRVREERFEDAGAVAEVV